MPMRTVFILDPEMKVRWRWITRPEQRLPEMPEVLAEAKKVAGNPSSRKKPAARSTKAAPKPGKAAG